MGGGLIQLVAYGIDDIYLTTDPQITFFKIVYRRHTNFSIEQIPQYFLNAPDFGKQSTCVISRSGDLIGNVVLVVVLPKVKAFVDQNVKFAWVKRIGFSLIKSVEIEINGKVIDKHYGEWLNIWAELTGQINSNQKRGTKIMIGDVPEMTDFSSTKDEYTLYIPLQFWFCKNSGSTLPLISLQYCDVKINVEFEDASKCYMLTPSHFINCMDDIVSFEPYEYIEQNIDGDKRAGIFINYDINTKRLYYHKLTDKKLLSIPINNSFDVTNQTIVNNLLNSTYGLKYSIIGKTSEYSTFAQLRSNTITYPLPKIRNLQLVNAFLIVDYYFLDNDERFKFSQSKHDYLIEQLYLTPSIKIEEGNYTAKFLADHPCKLMAWVTQLEYIDKSGDHFNYTDSYTDLCAKKSLIKNSAKSLIKTQTILINGNPRLSMRNGSYFSETQMYQYTKVTPSTGINIYSYGLSPFTAQPSGSCNTSQIDTLEIKLNLSSIVDQNNPAIFRGYNLCYNILRIVNGLAGLVFTN